MISILNVVFPVFLILAVSYMIGKTKRISLDPLIDISIYLAVPALVFTSILKEEFIMKDFSMLFFSAIFVVVLSGLILFLIFRFSKKDHSGLYLPIMFANTGNIGFPICLYAFGQAGLTQAVLFNTTMSLLVFSLGVYIAAKKMSLKEVFKLPLVYSAILGILFAIYHITIPEMIFRPLDLVGQAAIPLQLIILGISLSNVRLKSIKPAIFGTIARFTLGFALSLLFISLFNVQGLTKNIIILESIMPSALFTIILSHKYDKDPDTAASVVFITTALSIIVIPLVLLFLSQ
ncbi:MAG: AEC family transporter [Nanoarchaeota archaeon]